MAIWREKCKCNWETEAILSFVTFCNCSSHCGFLFPEIPWFNRFILDYQGLTLFVNDFHFRFWAKIQNGDKKWGDRWQWHFSAWLLVFFSQLRAKDALSFSQLSRLFCCPPQWCGVSVLSTSFGRNRETNQSFWRQKNLWLRAKIACWE